MRTTSAEHELRSSNRGVSHDPKPGNEPILADSAGKRPLIRLLEYAFNANVGTKREENRGIPQFGYSGPCSNAGGRTEDGREPLGTRLLSCRKCDLQQCAPRASRSLAGSYGLPVFCA